MVHGKQKTELLAGVDVGSTTTKIAVLKRDTHELLYSSYRRHHADQAGSVLKTVQEAFAKFPDGQFFMALTGSGAKNLAETLGLPFVQEVVANAIVLQQNYPQVRTAIELGGQDAKIIFFRQEPETGRLNTSDMRMNGSCAGGTGAFLDEMASVLKTPVEEFNALAEQGTCVYDISGRCGVYAKTDIQPLLNQGVAREDLALSALHAVAKQTIGGLAQGLTIEKPVAFEGGPLTFQPMLVRVFAGRLGLKEDEIIRPEKPELIIARGAALSLETLFRDQDSSVDPKTFLTRLQELCAHREGEPQNRGEPFFSSDAERRAFENRHRPGEMWQPNWRPGERVTAYLGMDSGSTTTKFVLMDDQERIFESFYAPNEGEPLRIAKQALLAVRDKYRKAGVELHIAAACSTGYGEMLFHRAFSTEGHLVETVAHAKATGKYVKDASFILDIGGQDMKAIWVERGIITNIVVNEACSSGCGSFLENFAASLQIPVEQIAETAFSSDHPAKLGSRCTVFMNSSIITEQRNGCLPADIIAGLCRSIIENVFTKVIRISDPSALGDHVVVQGGTFQNDAVLRALEQYLGKEVVRAPYPGMMGAIGAALRAKELAQEEGFYSTFIGLDQIETFTWEQKANLVCPFCMNHCNRTVVTFSNGASWITNNRCENGEILGDPRDGQVREQLAKRRKERTETPNLFRLREKLLLRKYDCPKPETARKTVIGIPRVLSFWDTMPFWTTFWRTLGFQIRVSDAATRAMYESGLPAVTSDTVCFPAKLVHGHLRNLAGYGVDRIFMPSITVIPSENQESTSISMCAVVKGYPIVVRNSDNPEKLWGIPFDAPLFHWYTKEDRKRQLTRYMEETFDISVVEVLQAIEAGDAAQAQFRETLKQEAGKVLESLRGTRQFAVVLASRPYQNEPLVNHGLPEMIAQMGIPVLTADSLPGLETVDLSKSRIDIVNNYHARMLASAVLAARDPNLEYIQLVNFGCGHDAYLSDEIQRMMGEISGRVPLILKVDESDVQGPLKIRVRSFIETVRSRHKIEKNPGVHTLEDPYPVKFTRKDKKEKVVLVPNTSHAFCCLMSAALSRQGLRAEPLPVGREEAIRLGKKYVHNDICFPAQIVIGEVLAALRSGNYDTDQVAVAMAKYIGDCRLTHYSALLRKALDAAGYEKVPILTNDDVDAHNLHPGFHMNVEASLCLAFGMPMIDALEELLRKMRPYELEPGSADRAFEEALQMLCGGMAHGGIRGAERGFERAIARMKEVRYDRSAIKPQVLIVGEYLLNFHPGANHEIERYLEKNGFEILEARMTDVIRKTYFYQNAQIHEYHVRADLKKRTWLSLVNRVFEMAHDATDRIAAGHPLYQKAERLPHLATENDQIIPHTFDAGEGILISGEILHHAKEGCRAFLILQPFGCLPNHVVGRGISKRLKELYPDIQILPLDYDPDVSFANVENRLQMLIMNQKVQETYSYCSLCDQ